MRNFLHSKKKWAKLPNKLKFMEFDIFQKNRIENLNIFIVFHFPQLLIRKIRIINSDNWFIHNSIFIWSITEMFCHNVYLLCVTEIFVVYNVVFDVDDSRVFWQLPWSKHILLFIRAIRIITRRIKPILLPNFYRIMCWFEINMNVSIYLVTLDLIYAKKFIHGFLQIII